MNLTRVEIRRKKEENQHEISAGLYSREQLVMGYEERQTHHIYWRLTLTRLYNTIIVYFLFSFDPLCMNTQHTVCSTLSTYMLLRTTTIYIYSIYYIYVCVCFIKTIAYTIYIQTPTAEVIHPVAL